MKNSLSLIALAITLTACGDDTFNYQFPEEAAPTPPVIDKPTPVPPTPVVPTPTPNPPCEKDHKCEDDDDDKKSRKS